jgi:glycosyltransferase involved in cell wall biosynthesis
LNNAFPITPEQKSGNEKGILFIGRLRSGCHLELLISTVRRLHNLGYSSITLHIIGDGPQAEHIQQMANGADWINFHGEIYSQELVSNISRKCMFGCYPGNAGLSIVHMMSLSLPPITHDDLQAHEGPEPSYISSGTNGLLFDSNNPEDGLLCALQAVINQPEYLKNLQTNAYASYERLTDPSLALRFINIVEKDLSLKQKVQFI